MGFTIMMGKREVIVLKLATMKDLPHSLQTCEAINKWIENHASDRIRVITKATVKELEQKGEG